MQVPHEAGPQHRWSAPHACPPAPAPPEPPEPPEPGGQLRTSQPHEPSACRKQRPVGPLILPSAHSKFASPSAGPQSEVGHVPPLPPPTPMQPALLDPALPRPALAEPALLAPALLAPALLAPALLQSAKNAGARINGPSHPAAKK